MRHALRLHPDSRCDAVRSIEVDLVRRSAGRLSLRYRAAGDMAGLAIPEPVAPRRADRLWEHTCFEVFLRRPGAEGYVEFNFSPSGAWAAYRFASRRRGMSNLLQFEAIPVALDVSETDIRLAVDLDLGVLDDPPPDGAWNVGLSTIIEERAGRKSYWALAHPDGNADFHHPDSFALDLPPPDAT